MSFIFSPFSNKEMTIANYNIASSNSEELLVVVIDSDFTFAKHIENLCQKLHALVRVANFMTLVMKTFVFSQFVTVENEITNLIDYKKGLYALYTMIKAQLLISCSKKTISDNSY